MIYKIIRTGSKGNALYFELDGLKLMIDCGVPWKDIRDLPLDAVLLTHAHGDHFNPSTVGKLIFERPRCFFFTPEPMVADMSAMLGMSGWGRLVQVNPARHQVHFMGDHLSVESFPLRHDVPNTGWMISDDKESMVYATDTADMAGLAFKNLDYYFLEANYDEEEIEESIKEKKAAGEYCYEERVKNTHLSRQQADRWLADNAGDNSKIIYMHEHSDAHGGEND